ncbi:MULTISPECIES: HNH endonuclease [Glaesserella]|uniref:HNH endonuclease n=1 Tax=Glaesserella australis TaxID=2094024 RepID=A0A328C0F0_9PAST|nr:MULTISPECIES: HNH endonuclease [Glaesserella]AUI65582.1 HNH endonuclease [Glaesserella sp. 15-184]RAL19779.1 HNH endonuclease [Glaesserella australis]
MPKGIAVKFTPEHISFLKALHAKDLPHQKITDYFNETFEMTLTRRQITAKLNRLGCFTEHKGRYPKGSIPWNKGVIGHIGANTTSFKAGHQPHNTKPVGSERLTKYGVMVKVAKTGRNDERWKFRSQIVWETTHGQIPKGYIIIHINGDNTDDRLENLDILSRSELLFLNSKKANIGELTFQQLSPEQRSYAITKAKLKSALSKKHKNAITK